MRAFIRRSIEILERSNLENNDNDHSAASFTSEQVYFYFKIKPLQIDNRQKKFSIYPEKYLLDITKYKEELFNALDPIFEALGFDVSLLREELLLISTADVKRVYIN